MNKMMPKPPVAEKAAAAGQVPHRTVKQQVVLVLQGGGALGAYQAGVYEALMEGGIEPDWVIGTSIGAINGALIAGNESKNRIARLRDFWDGITKPDPFGIMRLAAMFGNSFANLDTVMNGVPGFFKTNPYALWASRFPVGIERASYYTTDPLKATLGRLINFDCINRKRTRLTVGAVNIRSSEMRYFDSRDMELGAAHVMASGALPPAFPAVLIDGEPYWDGGIYSNTPIEVVLDDNPRRDSLIFSLNLWQPSGADPETIVAVTARQKDIQYASRGKSHVARQEQLHRLRHVVRELAKRIPAEQRDDPAVKDLASYGCGTTMHLVRLLTPSLAGEDHTKDIDFTREGIEARWRAGHDHAKRVLAEKPWESQADTLQGVVIHESSE
jgi:NTE family protein